MLVFGIFFGRYPVPRLELIFTIEVPHKYPPIFALPVCPQPKRNLPLLITPDKGLKNSSFEKRHEPASAWKPAQRLSGPKFEEPS